MNGERLQVLWLTYDSLGRSLVFYRLLLIYLFDLLKNIDKKIN